MLETVREYTRSATHLTGTAEDSGLRAWLHASLSKRGFHSIVDQEYAIGPLFIPHDCTVHFAGGNVARCYPVQPASCRSRTVLTLAHKDVHFAAGPWLNYELTNDGSLGTPPPDTQAVVVDDDWTEVGLGYLQDGCLLYTSPSPRDS